MLYYLAENPWPPLYLFGLIALVLLIALRITQQGKYLLYTAGVLGAGLLWLGIEQLWVTDNERIEAVVYDIGKGVETSDADRVVKHFAPDIVLSPGDFGPLPRVARSWASQVIISQIRSILGQSKFDYLRISRLQTHAGQRTRQGTAEFHTHAMLSVNTSVGQRNYATPVDGLSWSLGFRETQPGIWKVTRITPMNPPPGFHWPYGVPVSANN